MELCRIIIILRKIQQNNSLFTFLVAGASNLLGEPFGAVKYSTLYQELKGFIYGTGACERVKEREGRRKISTELSPPFRLKIAPVAPVPNGSPPAEWSAS